MWTLKTKNGYDCIDAVWCSAAETSTSCLAFQYIICDHIFCRMVDVVEVLKTLNFLICSYSAW